MYIPFFVVNYTYMYQHTFYIYVHSLSDTIALNIKCLLVKENTQALDKFNDKQTHVHVHVHRICTCKLYLLLLLLFSVDSCV